jgi:hypothetical protein
MVKLHTCISSVVSLQLMHTPTAAMPKTPQPSPVLIATFKTNVSFTVAVINRNSHNLSGRLSETPKFHICRRILPKKVRCFSWAAEWDVTALSPISGKGEGALAVDSGIS